MAAIAGSSVGALATFATTWLVQTNQEHIQRRGAELGKREKLYAEFIVEAAKRLTDSLSRQTETPDFLVLLVGSIGQMRLFSSPEVVTAAERLAGTIVDSYIAPNRTLMQLHEDFMDRSKLDPLAQFAEVCRKELSAITV